MRRWGGAGATPGAPLLLLLVILIQRPGATRSGHPMAGLQAVQIQIKIKITSKSKSKSKNRKSRPFPVLDTLGVKMKTPVPA